MRFLRHGNTRSLVLGANVGTAPGNGTEMNGRRPRHGPERKPSLGMGLIAFAPIERDRALGREHIAFIRRSQTQTQRLLPTIGHRQGPHDEEIADLEGAAGALCGQGLGREFRIGRARQGRGAVGQPVLVQHPVAFRPDPGLKEPVARGIAGCFRDQRQVDRHRRLGRHG